ncbi:MAG: hypothetical protein P8123_05530 [bacterium]
MMNFDERDAKEILDLAWLPAYENNMNSISYQMLMFNANLFILENIEAFDFPLFGGVNTTFWAVVYRSLYESCVMCAWRIAIDTDGDCLTISRLKNAILQHVKSVDDRRRLKEELKRIDVGHKIKDIKDRIQLLRHRLFAHHVQFSESAATQTKPSIPGVTLDDLRAVRDEVNEYISVLGFNTEYSQLPMDYDPNVIRPKDLDTRPDIVKILDDIAMRSPIVNMVENEPDYWSAFKNDLTKEQIDKINYYRTMLKKPAV